MIKGCDIMTFLEKLDMLMAHKNINPHILSKETDIPYTTIRNWYANGIDSVKLSTVEKLADYFNVSLDFFADRNTNTEYIKNAPADEGEGDSKNEQDINIIAEELRAFLSRYGHSRDGQTLTEEQIEALLVLLKAFSKGDG
jgi:transcriptional regulator with XRE-family HTH domain